MGWCFWREVFWRATVCAHTETARPRSEMASIWQPGSELEPGTSPAVERGGDDNKEQGHWNNL
jgi:hypothetical protein